MSAQQTFVLDGHSSMSGATLSDDGVYRYALWRVWDRDGDRLVWLMLNPSKADASLDDPTIRKCIGFAKRWGFGSIGVVNVAAFRATEPRDLYAARARGVDVVGPENAAHVETCLRAAHTAIAAWGANKADGFPAASAEFLRRFDNVYCLGRAKNGAPRHPLMLAYDTPREPYPGAR